MAVLRVKDDHGNLYDITAIKGDGITGAYIDHVGDDYNLMLRLTSGTEINAGALPNVASFVGAHTHGNVTYGGAIGSTPGLLVETGAGGAITASRKIVTGTTAPESVTGLNPGDIYIYYGA